MSTSPNMRSTYRVVPLDVNQPTYLRGPGATTGTFALESATDDLAHRLSVDPIELRLRNEPDHDQTGCPSPPGGLSSAFGEAPTNSAGRAETRHRVRYATATG